MSIDLSHQLDNAEDNNAAALLVSHFFFNKYFVEHRQLFTGFTQLSPPGLITHIAAWMHVSMMMKR